MPTDGGSLESKWTIDTGEIRSARGEFDKIVRQGDDGSRSWGGFFAKFSQIGNIITGIDSAINIVSRLVGVVSSVGHAFGAVIADGIEFGDTFAKAMAQLKPEEVEQFSGSLKELALQMGKETAFSAGEAAKGIEELLKAGLTASEIMGGALKTSLDAAAAGEMSVGDAAATVAINMKVFGLAAEDTTRIADLLAGAANLTTADVSEMSQALNQSGVVMKTLKIPIEDSVNLLSILAENGLKGSDAGTSLKTALLRLVPATDTAKEAYKTLGIEVFNANGELKPMREIVGELETGFKTLTDAEKIEYQTMIFGQDAIRASSILVEGGVAAWDKMKGSIGEFSAADVASAKLNSLAGDIEQMRGSQETLNISITEAFVPGLREATQWVTKIINKMLEWVQTNNDWLKVKITGAIQDLIKWITDLALKIDGIVTGMGGWEAVVVKVQSALSTAWTVISGAFSTAWAIMSPILTAMAGIFGDQGQVTTWGPNVEDFEKRTTSSLSNLSTVFSNTIGLIIPIVQAFGTLFGNLSVSIPDSLDTVLEYLGFFGKDAKERWDSVVKVFTGSGAGIGVALDTMTALMFKLYGNSLWNDYLDNLVKFSGATLETVRQTVEDKLGATASNYELHTTALDAMVQNAKLYYQDFATATETHYTHILTVADNYRVAMNQILESMGATQKEFTDDVMGDLAREQTIRQTAYDNAAVLREDSRINVLEYYQALKDRQDTAIADYIAYWDEYNRVANDGADKLKSALDRSEHIVQTFTFNIQNTLDAWQNGTVAAFDKVGTFIGGTFNPYMESFSESYFQFLEQVKRQFGEDAIPENIRDIPFEPGTGSTVPTPPTTVPQPPTTVTYTGSSTAKGKDVAASTSATATTASTDQLSQSATGILVQFFAAFREHAIGVKKLIEFGSKSTELLATIAERIGSQSAGSITITDSSPKSSFEGPPTGGYPVLETIRDFATWFEYEFFDGFLQDWNHDWYNMVFRAEDLYKQIIDAINRGRYDGKMFSEFDRYFRSTYVGAYIEDMNGALRFINAAANKIQEYTLGILKNTTKPVEPIAPKPPAPKPPTPPVVGPPTPPFPAPPEIGKPDPVDPRPTPPPVPIPPTPQPPTYVPNLRSAGAFGSLFGAMPFSDLLASAGRGIGDINLTVQTMDNISAIEAVVLNVLREVTDGKSLARARG